jgi:large subunit ribosomal protein L25
MSKLELKVSKRSITGRKVKKLRLSNQIPANIFGKSLKSLNISIDQKSFIKAFSQVGESSLLYLQVEDEKDARPVFVRQIVKDPVSGNLLHIGFNQVNLKDKVVAPVHILIVGESPAEKEKLGILVQQLDEVEIKALPTEMPEHIEVNVSNLQQVGDHIMVSDIKLKSGWEIISDSKAIIVQIEALAKEEVVTPPPSEAPAEVGEEAVSTETEPVAKASEKETEKTSDK